MAIKVFTIGVYGLSEDEFFKALVSSEVEIFCDVRWRRGMRGKEYSFVNSSKLQKSLGDLGIRYIHRKELAPPPSIRELQKIDDAENGVLKRSRHTLGDRFIEGYRECCLAEFDSTSLLRELAPLRNCLFFCVEREPESCHRSLIARRLCDDLGLELENLHPWKS